MDTNRIDCDQLAEMIFIAIKTSSPFAVARYGDGEYLVSSEHETTDITYIKHFGYVPSLAIKKQIAKNTLNSIQGLDAIGITELKSGTWGESRIFWENRAFQPIVSLDFHAYFTERGITIQMLSKANRLLYISGHTINFHKFNNLKEIIHLEVPLQQCKYNDNRVYFPDYFDETMETIGNMDLTGWFCLIGAGFVGKPFMMAIKNRGGIAIDLGSQMDRMAGYVIRGKEGQIATINETYKI